MVNKGPLILNIISTHRFDTLAVCETWIVDDDPDVIKLDTVPQGYAVVHVPRPSATSRNRGGGLCFIHCDSTAIQSPAPELIALHNIRVSAADADCERRPLWLYTNRRHHHHRHLPTAVLVVYQSDFVPRRTVRSAGATWRCHRRRSSHRLRHLHCARVDSTSIHADLISMLVAHDLQQFVDKPMRSTEAVSNLLHLVIGHTSY